MSIFRRTERWLWPLVVLLLLGLALYFFLSWGKSDQVTGLSLSQLVSSNCGIFLSLESSDELASNLIGEIGQFPQFGEKAKELEPAFPLLKSNLQAAWVWEKETPDFFFQGELKEPIDISSLSSLFNGMEIDQEKSPDGEILQVQGGLSFAIKGKILYASSSLEGVRKMLQGNETSPLERESQFQRLSEEVPPHKAFFAYANFSVIPDLPPELKSLYFFIEPVEDHLRLKGAISLDLTGIPASSSPEITPFAQAILELSKASALNHPFQITPQDAVMSISSSYLLYSLTPSIQELGGNFRDLNFSFLKGEFEFFFSSENAGVFPSLGLSLALSGDGKIQAQLFLKQIEETFSQDSEDFSFEKEEIDGTEVDILSLLKRNYYLALDDEHFFLSTSEETLGKMLANASGSGQSLMEDSQVQKALSEFQGQAYLELDGQKLSEALEDLNLGNIALPFPGRLLLALRLSPQEISLEGLTLP